LSNPISDQAVPPKLVLASRSPRRVELLRQAGYRFDIDPADIDEEDLPSDILPIDAALRLARSKSDAVAVRHPSDYVLGADTIVAFGDRMLGKPADEKEARSMLRLLSGTTHVVITGVALMRLASGYAVVQRVMSAVRMSRLSDRDIERYVQTGDWRGKAGGYGIQDQDPFVQRMSGCHTNIVGLPMTTTKAMLRTVGIKPVRKHE
jgi:septum formation protein